jgi:hypothetical protein
MLILFFVILSLLRLFAYLFILLFQSKNSILLKGEMPSPSPARSPVRSRSLSRARSPVRVASQEDPPIEPPTYENLQSALSPNPPRPRRPVNNPLQSYKRPEDTDSDHIVTFTEVVDELKTKYDYEETMTSTALDILALYLKGHKILHMEAKTVCEKRLNTLMLPAIFISSLCSILGFILDPYAYGKIIVSVLNTINSFLLGLVSYLKLDGKAEAHKMSSHKYQKLEAMCEFNSGRVLFFKEKSNKINEFVDEIQTKVMEIKESNQFVLPESIRYRFNEIFTTNVFTLVKEIQNDEIIVINDLKITVQKIQQTRRTICETKQGLEELEIKCCQQQQIIKGLKISKTEHMADEMKDMKEVIIDEIEMEEKKHLEIIAEIKEEEECLAKMEGELIKLEGDKIEALKKAIQHRKKYLELSNTFDDELEKDRDKQRGKYDVCNWCKT